MSFLPSIKIVPPHLLLLPKIRSKHHKTFPYFSMPSLSLPLLCLSLSLSLSGDNDLASPTHSFQLKERRREHVQPSPTAVPLSGAPSLSSPVAKKKNPEPSP
jgi:hypothetical protein